MLGHTLGKRHVCGLVFSVGVMLALGACTDPGQTAPPGEILASDQARILSPNVSDADAAELAEGNATFAFDLYGIAAAEEGNLFFSPYSISIALAMTYVGAREETETQMADALEFTLPQEQLHPAFNALDLELAARNSDDGVRLNVVNRLWGERTFTFLDTFLDTIAENYGASLSLMDFVGHPNESRIAINDWVADNTEQRIQNLIPQGVITSNTRLVLTNAIYFLADWAHVFEADDTADRPFNLLDGTSIDVPTMRQTEFFNYYDGDGYQIVELPYKDELLVMDVILPDEDGLADVEAMLDATTFAGMVDAMTLTDITLSLPKFQFTWSHSLKSMLADLGMPIAFTADADLSGMDGGAGGLAITEVVHKAFVAVDEEGTEAAAATAVIVDLTGAPEPGVAVVVDRPFIFVIRDKATDAILFVGRVADPTS